MDGQLRDLGRFRELMDTACPDDRALLTPIREFSGRNLNSFFLVRAPKEAVVYIYISCRVLLRLHVRNVSIYDPLQSNPSP